MSDNRCSRKAILRRFPLLCLLAFANLFLFDSAAAEPMHFAWDSLGGTLARDHQSRAMYYEGKHKRTYVVYMDHGFYARISHYDHEEKKWVYPPVLLDDCIQPDHAYNHAMKDGHNAPNLFITRDGTVHVFYGAHGTAFKYARTKEPEDIRPENWEIDMRVGEKGTYPYFAETSDGALRVFYRYSPTGGYRNPFLGMQVTRDNGKTWSQLEKLATFPEACKLFRGAYDPLQNRVHLMLHPRGPLGGRWGAVHCVYDPESGKLLALNGKTLGPMGTVETFKDNLPKIFYRMAEFVLHKGKPYFLYEDRESKLHFGYWEDGEWIDYSVPEGTMDELARRPAIHTSDGKSFRVFGITDWQRDGQTRPGGDITMWESSDGARRGPRAR